MAAHNDFGKWGEDRAEEYLRQQGYSILARDWHDGHKDLDVVAYDSKNDILVIVEVKTRHKEAVTTALQSVTRQKEKNIIHSAYAFARSIGRFFPNIRFDVITIVGTIENHKLTHYPNLFRPGNHRGRRLF